MFADMISSNRLRPDLEVAEGINNIDICFVETGFFYTYQDTQTN